MPREHVSLADLLRSRRQALGYSGYTLALLAGMDQSIITKIETKGRIPEPETLARLAEALELPLSDLYEAAGVPVPQLPSIRPYLRAAYHMTDAEIDDAEFYLRQRGARFSGPSRPRGREDELPDNEKGGVYP